MSGAAAFSAGEQLALLRSAFASLAVRFQSPLLGTFRFTSRLSPLRACLRHTLTTAQFRDSSDLYFVTFSAHFVFVVVLR